MDNKDLKKIPGYLLLIEFVLGIISAYFIFKGGEKVLKLVVISIFLCLSSFLSHKYLKNKFQTYLPIILWLVIMANELMVK